MKVLLVIDMQNDFITGSLGSPEACLILPSVLKKIKEFDGKIIFTRDTHQPYYLDTQEGKNLPIKHCIEGELGWEIEESLKPYADTVINKGTFGSKELATYLTTLNETETITDIDVIGLCTDICVVSNCLLTKAYLPEAVMTVDQGCCAGSTPERHKAALETLKSCQIHVI